MITSVFLSYATAPPDGQVAKAIHAALTKSGITIPAWRDREKLRGGDRFNEKFARAIKEAETFLFLLSPRSVASKWCRRELSRADGLDKPIVPLLLDEVSREVLPMHLEGLQYIDFRKGAAPPAPRPRAPRRFFRSSSPRAKAPGGTPPNRCSPPGMDHP